MIRTQISGKYSRENTGLFDFKKELISIGIEVNYPAADKIVTHNSKGHELTYDPAKENVSFAQMEVRFFTSIHNSTFHTLYNLFKRNAYIGKSSSIETLFAILCSKPIVVFSKEIVFSSGVSNEAQAIILQNAEKFLLYDPKQKMPRGNVEYIIPVEDKLAIYSLISNLFEEYKTIK